jgi:acetoin utilization protein AcuC
LTRAASRYGIVTFELDEQLTYPPGHPFRPERAAQLIDVLAGEGLIDESWCDLLPAEPASREELERFHLPEYLDLIERAGRGEISAEMLSHGLGGEDCPAFRGVYELARLAAGASLQGARLLLGGVYHAVLSPLGGFHHAGPSNAEGFCYVNDVVLSCMELAERGAKVACVDLDVHHGNGTETAFIDDPRVLVVSTHQSGKTLYPWSGSEKVLGEGAARGTNVNLPLLPGADDDAFLSVIDAVVIPVLRAHRPDVLVLEIGMDVLSGDPLASLRLTNNGMADAAERIRGLDVPMLVLGGGGYDPSRTARGWALTWSVLCDAEVEDDYIGSVGGVLLGSRERDGGGALREMREYSRGRERELIAADVERLIEFHRRELFPLLPKTSS